MTNCSFLFLALSLFAPGCGGNADDAGAPGCSCPLVRGTLTVTVIDSLSGGLIDTPSFTLDGALAPATCTVDVAADGGGCASWIIALKDDSGMVQQLITTAAGHSSQITNFQETVRVASPTPGHCGGCGVTIEPAAESVALLPL